MMKDTTPVAELPMRTQAKNALRHYGFETVGDVMKLLREEGTYGAERQLLRLPNFGRKGLTELMESIAPMFVPNEASATSKGVRMAERVARAIEEEGAYHLPGETRLDNFRRQALAALRAMEEPSEGMIRAGDMAGFKASVRTVSSDVFRAMVRAAIHEAETENKL
jgi:hypothetical protein